MKENKLKVLHICTSDSGGAGLCCLRIHKALLAEGIDSKVLTLNRSCKDVPEVYQYGFLRKYGTIYGLLYKLICKLMRILGIFTNDSFKIYKLGQKINATLSLPVSPYDLSKNSLVKQADIIHLHWVGNFLDYPSFFEKVNKPIVWTLHDENLFYGIYHYAPNKDWHFHIDDKYYQIKKDSVGKAKRLGLVFLARPMYLKYMDNVMIKGRKEVIINNPIDFDLFTPKDKQKSRNRFNIPEDSTVFTFVASNIYDPRKGLKVLVNAIKGMKINKPYILAVGNNEGGESLPYVHSVGSLSNYDDISTVYSCSDYLVMPSFAESFGQTPIEAMACGIPAIVFPTGIAEELINQKNGVCAKEFSITDLKEAIKQALHTKYNHDIIRQDVINRFSPSVIAKKYIAFYKSMLES